MVKQHIQKAHLGEQFEMLRVEGVCKSHWNCLYQSSWLWQNNAYHLAEPIWLQLLKAILRARIGQKLRISQCHQLNLEHCIGRINHIKSDTPQYTHLTGQACSLGTYCCLYPFHFTFSTVNGPHKGGHCGIRQQPGQHPRNFARSSHITRIQVWITLIIH